jgi:hypothetical protein
MRRKLTTSGWMFVIIPTIVSIFAGISNYATVSFGVYLKYQAMVDTYYLKVVAKENQQTQ